MAFQRFLLFIFLITVLSPLGAEEVLQGAVSIAPSAVLFHDLNNIAFVDDVEEQEEVESRQQEFRLKAVKILMTQTRYILSGMIYGYDFIYVPYDKKRGIQEEFNLIPKAQIPKGDTHLDIKQVIEEDDLFTIYLDYNMETVLQLRRDMALHSSSSVSGGVGVSSLQEEEFLVKSLEQAVKEALRAYLRPREYNKPRRITGFAVLQDFPRVTYHSGGCRTQVRICFRLESVESWGAY